jgi:hypothetical protein
MMEGPRSVTLTNRSWKAQKLPDPDLEHCSPHYTSIYSSIQVAWPIRKFDSCHYELREISYTGESRSREIIPNNELRSWVEYLFSAEAGLLMG